MSSLRGLCQGRAQTAGQTGPDQGWACVEGPLEGGGRRPRRGTSGNGALSPARLEPTLQNDESSSLNAFNHIFQHSTHEHLLLDVLSVHLSSSE